MIAFITLSMYWVGEAFFNLWKTSPLVMWLLWCLVIVEFATYFVIAMRKIND